MEVGVYSANATKVLLEIYTSSTGANATYDYWMTKGSDNIWRAAIATVPNKAMYAFRAWGPNWTYSSSWARGNSSAGFVSDCDSSGNRFNPNKVLTDPYALEITHDPTGSVLTAAGETNSIFCSGGADVCSTHVYSGTITGNSSINLRNIDTGKYAPKSVAIVDSTSTGTKPATALKSSAIYEAHLKGLTAHPSSISLTTLLSSFSGFSDVTNVPDAYRGTYKGAAYMAGYLKDMGYTAIELLPINESDNDTCSTTSNSGNYWGYMTNGYFAPDRHYAYDQTLGGPTAEFKAMVKSFHDAGIEVILDVVYNHTGEGGLWSSSYTDQASIYNFRGLDNATYYTLSSTYYYWDSTGCGNNFNAGATPARTLILAALKYWANTMGVDGFRFDEGAELGRSGSGDFSSTATTLTSIASLASTYSFKIIAEPWDCNSSDEFGSFPSGWACWNGGYRDSVRNYMIGTATTCSSLGYADSFYGSYSKANAQGGPQYSINMIDCHDGFNLTDLVSYDSKTNTSRAWPFGPSDGGSDTNYSSSWSYSASARRQAIRNFLTFMILSRGTPMQVWGDEFGRTVNGNNNSYDIDSVATWNNYNMIATTAPDAVATGDTSGGTETYHNNLGTYSGSYNQNFLFNQYLLQLRKSHVAFRQGDYSSVPITFTTNSGSSSFSETSDLCARIYVKGTSVSDNDFLIMSNMYTSGVSFTVPSAPTGTSWVRMIDTANWAESVANSWTSSSGTTISGSYTVNSKSIVVLMAK